MVIPPAVDTDRGGAPGLAHGITVSSKLEERAPTKGTTTNKPRGDVLSPDDGRKTTEDPIGALAAGATFRPCDTKTEEEDLAVSDTKYNIHWDGKTNAVTTPSK